jgi:4-hydroxybenzoate polyprenyltransferase
MLPLLGAAAARRGWSGPTTAWLLAVALAFHVYAYMLNDVIDLEVDRTEPLRSDSPLVRGTFPRKTALALALGAAPLAFGIAWAANAGEQALEALAVACVAMAVYDVWGKRCRWPLVTDAVQAVGWCALFAFGVPEFGLTVAHFWIGAYVFACVMLIQGVHGGLRDLVNDRRRGARTTALWFGARGAEGDTLKVPVAMTVYAAALQALMMACTLGAWSALGAVDIALAVPTGALVAGYLALTAALGSPRNRRSLINAGAVHIVASLTVLPALMTPVLPALGLAVLWLVFALPVLAMWAYNGSHWHLVQ